LRNRFGPREGVRRHHHEAAAEQGVGAGGEDRQFPGLPSNLKVHLGAQGFADPIALHQDHFVGPFAFQGL